MNSNDFYEVGNIILMIGKHDDVEHVKKYCRIKILYLERFDASSECSNNKYNISDLHPESKHPRLIA